METTQVRDVPTFNLPPVSEGTIDLSRFEDPFDQIREHDPSMEWEGSTVGQGELALRDGQGTEISEELSQAANPKVIDGEWTEGMPTDLITEPQTETSAATDMRQFGWAPTRETPEDEDPAIYGYCHEIIIDPDKVEEEKVGISDIFAGALGSLWDSVRGNGDAPSAGAPTWVGAGPTLQERLRPQETAAAPAMTPRFVESTPLTPEALPGSDVRETTELVPDDGPLAITGGPEAVDGLWSRLQGAARRS